MQRKARLEPVHGRFCIPPEFRGADPEWLNARLLAGLLARFPAWTENLLSVRECLWSGKEFTGAWPYVFGERIFALKAWNAGELVSGLNKADALYNQGIAFVKWEESFLVERLHKVRVIWRIPLAELPKAGNLFQEWLRAQRLPFTVRREPGGYRLDLPESARKKKILYAGAWREMEGHFVAELWAGPKCHFGQFYALAGRPGLPQQARLEVMDMEWLPLPDVK